MKALDVSSSDKLKKPVTLTVRSGLVKEARSLGVNTSQAAEDGIATAVRRAKERAWLEENKAAIEAYNERIEKHGTLLTPIWLED
jgi:antitoxin CcdA